MSRLIKTQQIVEAEFVLRQKSDSIASFRYTNQEGYPLHAFQMSTWVPPAAGITSSHHITLKLIVIRQNQNWLSLRHGVNTNLLMPPHIGGGNLISRFQVKIIEARIS